MAERGVQLPPATNDPDKRAKHLAQRETKRLQREDIRAQREVRRAGRIQSMIHLRASAMWEFDDDFFHIHLNLLGGEDQVHTELSETHPGWDKAPYKDVGSTLASLLDKRMEDNRDIHTAVVRIEDVISRADPHRGLLRQALRDGPDDALLSELTMTDLLRLADAGCFEEGVVDEARIFLVRQVIPDKFGDPSMSQIIDLKEAAKELGVSASSLRVWISQDRRAGKEDQMPFREHRFDRGKKWLVDRDAVREWYRTRRLHA